MSFKFQSLAHGFAWLAEHVVNEAKAVEGVIAKIENQAPVVEALTGLVAPQAVIVERAAFAVLGKASQAVVDAGAAAQSGGLNVSLDASEVADIKDIVAYLKSHPLASSVAANVNLKAS
jgi:hypothetical protein